jgi:hypothetical protein
MYTRRSRHVCDRERKGVVIMPMRKACRRYGAMICGREKRRYIVGSPRVMGVPFVGSM